ncbi:EAL domain-containing protein [Alteromonas lipolytica]|uniref:Diguanylate cyclase n=1 Tax=Alteromonas lipolytica TaxID=1856405 RepID=A0A1E8FG04_9ALTE|nr:EAL domain-containing protein [Alteromonas lipolytica]OFI34875.1 hypothetical protein BFC17_14990 [Alteromonas lipolytica]
MVRKLLLSCVLLSLWVIGLTLGAQDAVSAELSTEPLIANPVGTELSTQQGLRQDSIRDLLVDTDNFLWVATDEGLDRYDGNRVLPIVGDNDILASTAIDKLFLDSQQRLWISAAYRGLFIFNLTDNVVSKALELAHYDDPQMIQTAEQFIELPDGNMLILFRQSLVLYDVASEEHRILYRLPYEEGQRMPYLRDMLLVDNLLLLATSEGLKITRYAPQNLNFHALEHRQNVAPDLDNANTKRLRLTDDGTLWVGTVAGLYSMSWNAVKQAYRSASAVIPDARLILDKRNIWDIESPDKDLLWIGSDIGLLRVARVAGQWQADFILEPSVGDVAMSRQDVRAIALTHNNDLWIGSYLNGAIHWSPNSFNFSILQNHGTQKPLSNNVIWAIHEDDQQQLWIGSDNGLTRYNPKTEQSTFYIVKDGLPDSYSIHTIERIFPALQANKLLLSTYNGMLRFDMTSGEYESFNMGLDEDESMYVSGVGVGPDQQLYFVANHFYRYNQATNVLERLNQLEEQVPFNTASNFIGTNPLNNEEILLANYDGLWAYNPGTTEAHQLHRLPERLVNAELRPDKVNLNGHILWISYPGYGLVGLDAATYEQRYHFGRDVLGRAVVLFDLLKDDEGYFWFSSLNGLHRFSPSELKFTRYEYGRDLSIAEFNQGANQKLQDGRMVFGSPKGLVFFDPIKLNHNQQSKMLVDDTPQMVISDIGLSSRELNLPKHNLANMHLDLNHDDYGLTIEFSALEYHRARDTQFKYILSKGSQVLSEDITTDSRVVLPSLAAGEYRFEVSPVYRAREKAILPAGLIISVAYPPFLSPLAYTIYAFIGLSVILAYLISRHLQLVRLKQAQQQVKLFGNAFRHTSDWVVIFDEDHMPVAANPAFEKAFGIAPTERLDRQLHRLYQRVPKLEAQLSGQLNSLIEGDYWKGEDRIQMPDGRHYDVLIDINRMSEDKESGGTHFLLVISNITEQKNAERKLVKIANFDNLTGLVNRSLLLDRLEHAIANATSHSHTVAVLFVDLDRFKGINDSLGHDYGDKLLRVVANRMLNLASKSDTVARLGGDEFVIVMEEVENEVAVSSFVAQLIESIETPISLGKEVLRVSCSVGISFFPDDATEPAELLKQADVAMYSAKKSTLNAFIYYTREMNERAIERLALENLVKSAYEEQAFENYYQPIVNITTGKTEGVELLLRCHYRDEWISPAAFIPVLEELRHIIELTRKATDVAIDDLQQWYSDGFTGYISINLSALHFKTHFDLEYIQARLDEVGLPYSAIRFEITEGVLIDKSDEVLNELIRIREAGFKLALDDFGTGYSSLSYLRRFPLDILKIDKSFIDDVKESLEENALVQTTINLAHSLRMDCIAEGIEHSEQLQYLLNHGCCLMQGYYFSKPVDARTVRPLLTKHWQTPLVSFNPII